MRVVLDTNVLVAAFVARGVCNELFEHVVRVHELVASDHILAEFERALVRKLRIPGRDAKEAIALLQGRVVLVRPTDIDASTCRDRTDLPVLGTAVAGACDCVVTGDRELQDLKTFRGIPIVRPADFWRFESERGSRQDRV